MSSKVFIDTNILVYSVDASEPKRRSQCRKMLKQTSDGIAGVISTQVMQEFYVSATRKLGVDPLAAKGMLKLFENFEVITIDPTLIKDAIDCHILNRISFWDALIVVSAQSARCQTIWTEDLNDGQVINGVQIQNPIS